MAEWPLEHGLRGAWAPPLREYIDESVDGVAVDVAGKADQVDLDATNAEVAGKQDALAVGNAGDQVVNLGGVLNPLKPGRIDVRQRGAVGDGTTNNTTLINNLIANAGGESLFFPDGGVFVCAPKLKNGSHLTGGGTIKAPSGYSEQGVILPDSGQTHHMSVDGVTIDCRNLTSGVTMWDGKEDVSLTNLVVINVGTAADHDKGLRLLKSVRAYVDNVEVQGGNNALTAYSPVDSVFSDIRGYNQIVNAFSFVAEESARRGNSWKNLKGRGVGRHGLEMIASGGYFDGGFIDGCDMEVNGTSSEEMGFSLPGIRNGRVTNNRSYSPNTTSQYGYEIGGESMEVIGNVAEGFGHGFITNANSDCSISSNRSLRALVAFQVEGSGNAQYNHRFSNNLAQSFRDGAYHIFGQQHAGSGGHKLVSNVAVRDLGWTGDSGRSPEVFKLASASGGAYKMAPCDIVSNTFEWREAASAVTNMDMVKFISSNSGSLVGTVYNWNRVIKRASAGTAWLNLTGGGSGSDTDIGSLSGRGNTKTNYQGTTTAMDSYDAGFTS